MLRILGDDDGREDLGHVVLRLFGQLSAFVELPEIGIARSLDGVLHIARAMVVGGHGQVPVAQLAVDELHVAGVGARRFLGIEALVHVGIAGQAVIGAGHELPHAARVRFAIDRLRLEARFGHRQVDQILRHPFFGQYALDHRLVAAGALKRMQQRIVALLRVGEKVDEGCHVVVYHQRQIRFGRGQVGRSLGHQVGIDGRGYVAGGFGRRDLLFGHKAVALLEGLHLEAVDLVDDLVELVLQLRVGLDVEAARKHEIDGAIELNLGFSEHALAVVGVAGGVCGFNLRDELLCALLLGGQLPGWGSRSGSWRNGSLKRRRGGLRGLAGWPHGSVSRRAAGERQQEQDAGRRQECAAHA